MKSLTNCSALFKPSSISNREQPSKPSKSYLITEQKPKNKLQLSIRKVKPNIKFLNILVIYSLKWVDVKNIEITEIGTTSNLKFSQVNIYI